MAKVCQNHRRRRAGAESVLVNFNVSDPSRNTS